MKHAIAHHLDLPTAIVAAHKAAEAYALRLAKYQPTTTWVRETQADIHFKAKGIDLKGTIRVDKGHIEFELHVPLLLRPFQALAVPILEREVREWIGKAERHELDA